MTRGTKSLAVAHVEHGATLRHGLNVIHLAGRMATRSAGPHIASHHRLTHSIPAARVSLSCRRAYLMLSASAALGSHLRTAGLGAPTDDRHGCLVGERASSPSRNGRSVDVGGSCCHHCTHRCAMPRPMPRRAGRPASHSRACSAQCVHADRSCARYPPRLVRSDAPSPRYRGRGG